MSAGSRKIGKISICAAILVASAAFFLTGLLNPVPRTRAGAAPGGTTGSPVTAINIDSQITPNPATPGDMVTAGGTLSIVGGPAQVKFTITYPMGDGSIIEGSFEMPLDENGVWGFQAPPAPAGSTPGTHEVTIKAEAGDVSVTKTISFTINPAP